MSKVKDLTGQRFGRLLVIERAENTKEGKACWVCVCDCGETSVKVGQLLRNGHCKSCGCGEYENRVNNCTSHRMSDTRLYNIWQGMKQRCYYPKHKNFHVYGGRGITVCDEWRNDFVAFYEWAIANGYRDDLSIDRIDNDGNYEPNNCRWETSVGQARNRSQNVYITLNGETRLIMDWCKILDIPYHVVHYRLQKGMTPEDAFRKRVV